MIPLWSPIQFCTASPVEQQTGPQDCKAFVFLVKRTGGQRWEVEPTSDLLTLKLTDLGLRGSWGASEVR